MIKIPLLARLSTIALAMSMFGSVALAEEFPTGKAITMVVGFSAGGGTDTAARIIAKKLSDNLGQSVVVDNRPGAGGNIAHQLVATAKPDGTTILLGSIGPLSIAPHLMKLPYDPVRDLAPITMGVNFPNVLVVHPGVGVKTFKEYLALAKEKPGSLEYASTGIGSASHMAGELLNHRAGVEIVHIPYKGGSPALVDVVGGRVAAYYPTPSSAAPHIANGKVIALATTGLTRPEFMADIPTIAESGFPGFEALNWYAFVAPGKTPVPLLDRWNKEIVKVLNDADVKEALLKHGLTPQPTTRAAFAAFMKKESTQWAAIIKERKLTAD